ncbi:MAG: benzil reductase ((S)-benzoin forming) [Lysobacterales bacterium]|jgi:benzil reductase ((S)-benzoin forming)
MNSMLNRVALVTGTSSGIGEAIVFELLNRDWDVIGISRRAVDFENPRYSHLCIDLADVKRLAIEVEEKLLHVISNPDLERFALINNAADVGLLGTVDQIDPTAMLRTYTINTAAPIWLMGWLVRNGRDELIKRVVNVSTGAAVKAYAGFGAYGNTKAALRMAGQVLATELESSTRPGMDTSVLSYEPGVVDTQMQETVRSSSVETMPIVGYFQQLNENGLLVAPAGPAKEIVDYIESDGHEVFEEHRFSGDSLKQTD